MKNIIAVTACLKKCSVSILYDGHLHEVNEDVDAASNLVFLANNLAESRGIDLRKIDGIITSSGPGSFTGIRTAQSFVKGLALSLKLQSASVSYFDVIEHMHIKNKPSAEHTRVAVIVKSENNQVYYRVSEIFENRVIKSETPGISAYNCLKDHIKNCTILSGDAISEAVQYLENSIVDIHYFPDFKKSKHLLDFTSRITPSSKIEVIYSKFGAQIH